MARKLRVKASVRRAAEERLRRIARVGEVFLDGDAFKRVALKPELNTGDEYCVDHEAFIQTKQALLKLKRIEPGDLGAQAWRRFGSEADICVPVDTYVLSVRPGNHPITPAMAEALEGRTAVQDLEMRGVPILSVCAPIRDSLGDVTGILEVFTSLAPERWRVSALAPDFPTE